MDRGTPDTAGTRGEGAALNLANVISVSRLILLPFFLLSVFYGRAGVALGILTLAGVTDYLDGMIARRMNLQTTFGEYLDPAADKLLAVSGFIVLTMDLGYANRLPVWLTILIFARDVLIVVGALCMYLASGKYRFPATQLGQIHSTVVPITLGMFLLHNALGVTTFWIPLCVWATLVTTLTSGIHYAWISIAPSTLSGTHERPDLGAPEE